MSKPKFQEECIDSQNNLAPREENSTTMEALYSVTRNFTNRWSCCF